MDNFVFFGLMMIVIGVGVCFGYFYFFNIVFDRVIFLVKGVNVGWNINWVNMVWLWLFLFLVLFVLIFYLVYFVFEILWLLLIDCFQDGVFVGLVNYWQMMNEVKFWEVVCNNMFWLIVVLVVVIVFGLLVVQLIDWIKWGNFVKLLIFMLMVILFVGVLVIFKLIYDMCLEDQN